MRRRHSFAHSLANPCLASLLAISLLATARGADAPAPPPKEPAPVAASAASKALDDLEARSPKDWQNRKLIEEINAGVISLVETNTLATAGDFHRAAQLARRDFGEYRTARVCYELLLTAAAHGSTEAEKDLPAEWDTVMHLLGRPQRLDPFGMAPKYPDEYQLDAAPTCIKSVIADPATARTAAAAKDNPEIKTIVDADQADRKSDWSKFTDEDRKAQMGRDHGRNARMREIVKAGELHTANDFARASLVLQHSATFAGFQLAHELAVASMLLGDRGSGCWLVTATYDRMLRSVGHDQRFGTQMGSQGPLYVDEAGICDAERQALGCPTLAEARTRHSPKPAAAPKPASQ